MSENSNDDLSESRIQQDCAIWYNNTYCLAHYKPRCLIFAVPNENTPRLLQTGGLKGVSDLVAAHVEEGYMVRLIFAEIKTPTGKQRPDQKKFESHVTSMGFEYYIVRSLEEFKTIILNK